MARRPSPSQRLLTAARWPVGVGLTSWRYLWRLTPVDRWEWSGSQHDDAAPELPPGVSLEDLQRPEDGAGALVHRLYRVRIRGSPLGSDELVSRLGDDLNEVAPSEFARFEKVHGQQGELQAGDEYVVRMPGPWDGPVRVVERTPCSFRLATLAGHLEAGQIEFRVRSRDRALEFTIESWARSGDRLSDLLYSHLRLAKEVQLHMWTSVLERIVELSRGHRHGPLAIVTRRIAAEGERSEGEGERGEGDGQHERGKPSDRRARRALVQLEGRSLNFDPDARHLFTPDNGWHLDDMTRPLPGEPSGPPVEDGSWQIVRQLMLDYQVADPHLVRATYRHGAPLAGRDMLLEIRYRGLRLHVGVRVGDVYDETRTVDGRDARVFGWGYRTLEGHFEQGELHYEVWKWLDTGAVEFRLHGFSRVADSGPLLLRMGYRLIGRRNQLDFYRRACRRVAQFAQAQLELERSSGG